jgi:ABC-type nitrate/sulfonate/bicarbonate transport system substrate-binding protein
MRCRERFVLLALALAALAALAAGCGGTSEPAADREPGRPAAAEPRQLKVGYAFGFDVGDAADEVGFDIARRDPGIEVEHTDIGNPQNAFVAIERGDVDVVKTAILSLAQANLAGAEHRMILLGRAANDWVFVGHGIARPSDLRDARLGFQLPGGEMEMFTRKLLEDSGIDAGEVELVALPDSRNRARALVADRLDAAWLEYPDYLRLADEGEDVHVLARGADVLPFSATVGFVVSRAFADDNRDLLQHFVDSMLAGYESVHGGAAREEWSARAEDALAADADDLAARLYGYYREIGAWPRRTDPPTSGQWDQRVAFWLERGLVDSRPDFETTWDLSFWRQAAEK